MSPGSPDLAATLLRKSFSDKRSVPAPPPLAGPLDHCGSDRIEMNVTNQFQKITIPIAHDRLVAPLKQMPPTAVDLVKAPHVAGEQRLQDARRGKPIDFQQQVEVLCEAPNYVKLISLHF
jgi:hypothetical protein